MIRLLCGDLYRIVRKPSLWVCLLITALLAASVTFVGSFALSMYDSATVEEVVNQLRNGVAIADLQGDEMVVGAVSLGYGPFLSTISFSVTMPFVSFFASLAIVLLVSEDFETGFIKNIFTARRDRGVYYGEKLIVILIVSLGFVLAALIVTVVYRAIIDAFYTTIDPALEIVTWLAATWLTTSAYAMICAVIVWLTRSKVIATLAAALVSTGILATIGSSILESVADAQVSTSVLNWTLSGVNGLLTQSAGNLYGAGPFPPALQILLTLACWFAVVIILTFTACRAKDI